MRRFGYYWKEGLRNIFKHGFMSIAAIAIMVACLILTGTVTLIAYNIDLSIVDLQQSNEIVVWIDENLTTREAKDLQPQFEKIGNIARSWARMRASSRTTIPRTTRCATATS